MIVLPSFQFFLQDELVYHLLFLVEVEFFFQKRGEIFFLREACSKEEAWALELDGIPAETLKLVNISEPSLMCKMGLTI